MLTFRQAQLDDATAIASLHVASWQWAYREILPDAFLRKLSSDDRVPGWTRILESGESRVLMAHLDGALAGWVSYGKCRDADKDVSWGEIHALYLNPPYLRKGIGSALVDHVTAGLKEQQFAYVSAWVLEKNTHARRFYERMGFVAEENAKSIEIGGVSVAEIRYSRRLSET